MCALLKAHRDCCALKIEKFIMVEYIFMLIFVYPRWNIYIRYYERKDLTILLVLGNSIISKQHYFVTFFHPQQTVHLFVWFHIDWLSQLHNNVLGGEDGFPTLFTVYSKIRLFTNYFISNHPDLSSVHLTTTMMLEKRFLLYFDLHSLVTRLDLIRQLY